MNYPDLTHDLGEIFASDNPSGLFTDRMTADLVYSMRNLQPDRALAFATCLLNATQKARDLAAEFFINDLDFDPYSGQKYNDGRNFTSQNNLVFRVNTKVDYNYQQNDDLEADYGRTYADLKNMQEINTSEAKLLTRQIDLRKRLILNRHPRMQPIPGSIKHSVSYIGTFIEATGKAQMGGDS